MAAPDPVDNMAPQYRIQVADQDLPADLVRFIRTVEYESADGIVDMARIRLSNPDFVFSESKMFQPGNEMNIYMGYGEAQFIGRVEISKMRCDFPKAAMPTAEIIGYTRDHAMMDNAPEEGSERVFFEPSILEIMDRVASRYGYFTASDDIDNFQYTRNLTQKAGMSDYDLVKGLANVAGFLFWIDGNEEGRWTMHLIDPAGRVGKSPLQDKKYTFKYGQGEFTTLLDFNPEYAVRGARTKITIAIRDPERGEDFIEVVEEEKEAPDLKSKAKASEEEKIEGPIPSGATIKLYFGEFSLEIVPNKHFVDAKEARIWAQQWFRRQRENFIVGNGTLIGVENLRARQVHTLDGLGVAFNGDYYFTRARHLMTAGGGYFVDFSARKHVQ